MSRHVPHVITRRSLLRRAAKTTASAAALSLWPGCVRDHPPDGKLHLVYWEKWERFEGQAMKAVVRAFNESQPDIVVHYVSSSAAADRKTLTATAGGDPPDVSGLWDGNLVPFAEHGALTSLDPYMKRDGITRDHWIDVYADICTHNGHMYAVPTTPATIGLHWNEGLFRASADKLRAEGFDPDEPPKTLEDLDAYARLLTKENRSGRIEQMGFLPHDPIQNWFAWAYPAWFGGAWFDGNKVTANQPRNVAAFEWIQSYSREYGAEKLNAFAGGFGNFASPQNPFFNGKLAMIFQGTWLNNYISQYAPGMQWSAAPMPKVPGGPDEFTVAQCDILVIPAGVPQHRRDAAWEFVRFAIRQDMMELLNRGQKKFTPIRKVSEAFLYRHPHKRIRLFIEMAFYRNALPPPDSGIWKQYMVELNGVLEQMRLLTTNPATGRPFTAAESLDVLQRRVELANRRHLESLARRAGAGEADL